MAASPRAHRHARVAALRVLKKGVRRRRAVLFSASRDRHRSFNRDRRIPVCGPGLGSAPVEVKGAAMARAFDRGKLIFSKKLTAATVNAYLAVQRIYRGRLGGRGLSLV